MVFYFCRYDSMHFRIAVVTTRQIEEGEEFLAEYGDGFWDNAVENISHESQ